ncbi:unnamed protein product, partial [Rotaria sp. Silwood1]
LQTTNQQVIPTYIPSAIQQPSIQTNIQDIQQPISALTRPIIREPRSLSVPPVIQQPFIQTTNEQIQQVTPTYIRSH